LPSAVGDDRVDDFAALRPLSDDETPYRRSLLRLSSSATGASLSLSTGKGEIELASRATGEPSIHAP